MNAVVLTWRPQNILSIWVMVIALFFLVTFVRQAMMRFEGAKAANDG